MSWTVAVFCCPELSTQPSDTLSPGRWLANAPLRSVIEPTGVPFTETIVSPAVRPALSAGLPGSTPLTGTPAELGSVNPPAEPVS